MASISPRSSQSVHAIDSFFRNISSKYADSAGEDYSRNNSNNSAATDMKNRLIEGPSQASGTSAKRAKLSNGESSPRRVLNNVEDDDVDTLDVVEFQQNGVDNEFLTSSEAIGGKSLTTPNKMPPYDPAGQHPTDSSSTSNHFSAQSSPPHSPSLAPVGLLFPPVYYDESPEYFQADDQWMTHSSWQWMYCITDGSYYHVESNTFYYYDPSTATFDKVPTEDEGATQEATSDYPNDYEAGEYAYEEGAQEDEEEGEGFFLLDFEKDISVSTSEIMTDFKGKTEREDRHVTKELLPLDLVSDTEACCFFTGIFDGHGGSTCAEYCVKHLSTNLITTYRQAKETIAKKLRKQTVALGRDAATTDIGLSYSTEVEALRRALQKSFEITNQNYLSLAERKGYTDGCTALVVLVYGPDEDGTLKVMTAHAGDCRAVMCRELNALRLTEDHKPERKEERRRIEAAGGKVVYMKEVWRVTAAVGKKLFGLSTARSIGDLHMKRPKELVTATPDLRIVTVDFNRDQFIILGSDGVWDVMTDQEACDVVNSIVAESNSTQEAADALTKLAKKRGSSDDKTATVILFSWHSQVTASDTQ